jgi:DNA gyrase subunit A
VPLEAGEKVQAVLPVREYLEDRFVFFATANGTVKKTPLTEYAFQLARGKIAINLDEGDALVMRTHRWRRDVMLFASNGKVVRFDEARCARWDAPPPACAACASPKGELRGQPDRGNGRGRHPHRQRAASASARRSTNIRRRAVAPRA